MDGGEWSGDNGKENDSPVDHIIDDVESFWLDIYGRLTVSRMVSDSVIKGMVNAVEQQAAERIAQKELEVVGLKKMLNNSHVGSFETKALLSSSESYYEPHEAAACHCSGSVAEHDRLIESVGSLQISVNEQLKQLKKEISKIRGASSIGKISSGSDLVGLGGLLEENVIDKTFESLKGTLDTICRRMKVMDQLSKASLSEWQEEQELRSEIERMVISNCIWSLQEEFEQKLWELYDTDSRNWFNQHKEISCLRQELDSIFKTLSVSETGLLISHGSLENGEEWGHHKRADHFHWKPSTNHLSPSTSEENGNQEGSKINKSENLDPASLKHMSRDELVHHYSSEITKMRRNHESQVQEMTEENFRLKRELLKERDSSFPLKKDKEFDLLKKKIPDVILKLDKILVGNEKVHQFSENIESLSSVKDRLDFLHSENHQLKDMLTDKEKELKSLASQLAADVEKLSQQQLTEKKLLQTIQELEDCRGDAHAEVSVIHDVYKFHFEDITSEFRCVTEELLMKNSTMEEIYKVILKEAAHSAQASSRSEIEEEDMESTMMQALLDVIFKEALVDANIALKFEAAEKEKLKQEKLRLTSLMEEKEKLAREAADALVQEAQKIEWASKELNCLRAEIAQQQKLIAENNKKLDVTKGDLVAALKEIEQYREQMESTIVHCQKLLTMVSKFEVIVNQDISRTCLRLENMRSEFCCLNNKANILKTTGLMYKQSLETRCSDLAKAEAEVDLLGDEVDTLLSLLEKIYISLDHYSSILQHYPGIIETLELVRRELSGESRKLV